MKKYFINKGTEKKGPFTLEELKEMDLTEDYLVWANDFDDWTKITEVEQLKDIIVDSPPLTPMEKKKIRKKGSIKRIISNWIYITLILWVFISPILIVLVNFIPKSLFYNDKYPVYGVDSLDTMIIVILIIASFLLSAIIGFILSIKTERKKYKK